MFYPGDIVQTRGNPYIFLEVVSDEGGDVKCQHTVYIGGEIESTVISPIFPADELVHVGVARPLYKEPTDDEI